MACSMNRYIQLLHQFVNDNRTKRLLSQLLKFPVVTHGETQSLSLSLRQLTQIYQLLSWELCVGAQWGNQRSVRHGANFVAIDIAGRGFVVESRNAFDMRIIKHLMRSTVK